MPFKSKAQAAWMFKHYPSMAKRWADHTPNFKSLPYHKDKPDKKPKKKKY